MPSCSHSCRSPGPDLPQTAACSDREPSRCLGGNDRGFHHAPDRCTSRSGSCAGLGGAAVIAGLFDRVFEYLDVVPDIVDAPVPSTLPVTEAGGRACGTSTSAIPVSRRRLVRRQPRANPATGGWWGRAEQARPPSATWSAPVTTSRRGRSVITGSTFGTSASSLAAVIGFVTQESTSSTTRPGEHPVRASGASREEWRRRRGGLHPRPDHGIL